MADESTTKRSTDDLGVIIDRASAADWLHVQRKVEMTMEEIQADNAIFLAIVAYFIEKQAGPGAKFDRWLHAPLSEVTDFVNLDLDEFQDEEGDAPNP